MADIQTTGLDDLLAMDKRELMDEVMRLRSVIGSVQRSAFDAGFDAGMAPGFKDRIWAYRKWSNT